jgi:hypothetical protein
MVSSPAPLARPQGKAASPKILAQTNKTEPIKLV